MYRSIARNYEYQHFNEYELQETKYMAMSYDEYNTVTVTRYSMKSQLGHTTPSLNEGTQIFIQIFSHVPLILQFMSPTDSMKKRVKLMNGCLSLTTELISAPVESVY